MKKFFIFLSIIFMIFLNISCSTGSDQKQGSSAVPAWTTTVPVDNDYYYFTGSGGPKDYTPEAEEIAMGDIQSKLFLLIGATVSTYLENNQYYEKSNNKEEFETYLKSIVQVEGKGIISQFEIIDKYVKKTENNQYIVYILARISKIAVKKEQQRLEKIYQEKLDAFLIPEQKGNDFFKQGLFFDAILNYLIASKNALLSDYENKLIVSERNLDAILLISKKMSADIILPEKPLYSKEEQKEPFAYSIVYKDKGNSYPVPNVPVKFFYKTVNNKNEILTEEVKSITDDKGKAYFHYEKVPYSGKIPLIAFIDINDLLDEYVKVTKEQVPAIKDKANLLKSNFGNLKINTDFIVFSRTISQKTGIGFVFTDEKNTILQGINPSGFLSGLTQLGLNYSSSVSFDLTPQMNISQYIKDNAQKFLKNGLQRVIIIEGTVKSIKEYSGKQIASISLNAYVFDLQNGTQQIYQVNITGNGDTVISGIIDAYQKGLSKISELLAMYL